MKDEYDAAIGFSEHQIGDIKHIIFPIEGDNLRIARIMKNATKNGIDWLYSEFNQLYFDMVTREPTQFERDAESQRKPVPKEKHAKLKLWIERNQVQINKDLLVIFGWQTKEQQDKLENMESSDLKKLISA